MDPDNCAVFQDILLIGQVCLDFGSIKAVKSNGFIPLMSSENVTAIFLTNSFQNVNESSAGLSVAIRFFVQEETLT